MKSKAATFLLSDLMALDPNQRHRWYETLSDSDTRALIAETKDQLGTVYGMFQDDYLGFVRIVMGETLWPRQAEIVASVQANTRTAVPSCADAGKSHVAARIVLAHGSVWPIGLAKVVTTATKDRQVVKELWPHIRAGHAKAKLPGRCLTKEWQMGDLNFPVAYGYSPKDTDETAFSGIHAMHLLVIVDEAGGISPTLGRSLEGMMTEGDARMLLIGNPSFDETGTPWFEERCDRPTYNVIRIPASETPNFTGTPTDLCRTHPDIPTHPISEHLVSKRWVDELADDYGTDDPYYIARVLAEFPKDLANKVIPRSFVDAALVDPSALPEERTGPDVPIALGVDPAAGGGDELAVARRVGDVVRIVKADRMNSSVTPHEVAGLVLTEIESALTERARIGSTQRIRVKVENDGGIGWSVAGTLKAWGSEGRFPTDAVSIIPITVGSSPDTPKEKDQHANKRSSLWWNGRAMFSPTRVEHPDTGELIDGPPSVWLDVDETTARQLSTPNQKWSTSGKKLVESKEEIRKRGIKSPDRADAVLLCLYDPRGTSTAKLSTFGGRLPAPRSKWN